jgi:hypothetical protein
MDSKPDPDLVLLHNSHWASNIGNPFFTLGVEYALKQALDDARIVQTDQLSGMAWGPSKRQHQRDLKYPQYSDCDWFVLCGPLLNQNFIRYYDDLLENVPMKETKLVLLNVGGIRYDESEIQLCRSFLKKHSPHVLFSRDEKTYKAYADLAEHSHNGIDFAFFAPDYYPGYDTPRLEPYVTYTFDSQREPYFSIEGLTGEEYEIKIHIRSGLLDRIPHRIGKYLPERRPSSVHEHRIVRPIHGVLHSSRYQLYKKQNTFFSQTPFGYLNLYRNTTLAISDRLHGVIPTLAYGNPARLVSDSPRTHLFSRIGLTDVTNQVVTADLDLIEEEKTAMLDRLAEIHES